MNRFRVRPRSMVRPGMRSTALATTFAILVLLVPAAAGAQWESPTRAFHKDTAFPLDGRHLTVACASCHLNGVTKGTPTTCVGCHWARRQDDRYRLRLGSACEQCHRPTSWTDTTWNHATATGVAIGASHSTLGCQSCHTGGQFSGGTTGCVTCHQKEYDATREPNHRAAGFPTQCEGCHRPSDVSFSSARFDHNATFALVGVHAAQSCAACHTSGSYRGAPRDCIGCHRRDYDQTRNPAHAAAGFSTACDSCHRPTDASWRGGNASFRHADVFPLVGQHAVQNCAACHASGRYSGTPRDCIGCHRTDYDRTSRPNHAAAGFSTACDSCHRATDAAWIGVAFDHNAVFRLQGAHATTSCASCHAGGVYKGTPRDCVGCHRTEYDRTTSPNHAAAGYTTACESCHRVTDPSWRGAQIDHNQFFPLVGRHSTTNCTACHGDGRYKGTPRECYPCHRTQYERTTQPSHTAAGFSTACEPCHRAADASWMSGTFDHSAVFALQGVHATTGCASCHGTGVYKGTPRDCVGCHRPEYDRTTSPNHQAAAFPTTCESCHRATDTSWSQGRFAHTWFPITSGKHAGIACATCHTNPNNYIEFTCLTCHLRPQMDDKHKERAGYRYESTACYACHPTGRS